MLIIAYGALRLDASLEQVQQSGSLEQVFLREVEAAGSAQEPEEAPA